MSVESCAATRAGVTGMCINRRTCVRKCTHANLQNKHKSHCKCERTQQQKKKKQQNYNCSNHGSSNRSSSNRGRNHSSNINTKHHCYHAIAKP